MVSRTPLGCVDCNQKLVVLYRVSWQSHPTGVRGLKFAGCLRLGDHAIVAPHWGAWIEISALFGVFISCATVAPHWGAWIEIYSQQSADWAYQSRTPLGCVD